MNHPLCLPLGRIIIDDRQGQKWIEPSLSIRMDLDSEYFSSSLRQYSDEGFPSSVLIFLRITNRIGENILREKEEEEEERINSVAFLSCISANP